MFAAIVMIAIACLTQTSTNDLASSRIERRVVKLFDFNEAPRGNYEETPMNWAMHLGQGFPRYLAARFDSSVGHEAPPCMALSLLGGSLGAVYEGRDIPVHPQSTYQVVGWIRPDRLVHARACMTAYFLDRAMHKIESSERQSELVGGGSEREAWQPFVIDLPSGVEDARWIGLACWVLQPDRHSQPTAGPRPIRREDFHGGAWFDDLCILRLPRVTLEMNHNPSLFNVDDPITLRAQVQDPDGVGIRADLVVADADGRIVLERTLPVATGEETPTCVDLSDVEPGWYSARATVRADRRELVRREIGFARVAADLPGKTGGLNGIGTVLDASYSDTWPATRRLLSELSLQAVKIPFWSSNLAAEDILGDIQTDRALHDLKMDGTQVIAVLAEPPAVLAGAFEPSKRSLLDVLCSSPGVWRPYLALPLSRGAASIGFWQVGQDGDDTLLTDRRWSTAMARVRDEIGALTGTPLMAAPWSVLHSPGLDHPPATFLSLTAPAAVAPEHLPDQLASFSNHGYSGLWTVVQPLDRGQYERRHCLADLARRIIMARIGGAQLVFVPQPWKAEPHGGQPQLTPCEDYLVIRTMAQVLAGSATPIRLAIHDEVTAWLFPRSDGSGTIVAWCNHDEATPLSAPLPLGPQASQYDLFGRRAHSAPTITQCDHFAPGTQPESTAKRCIAVGYLPTIITPVDASLVLLQASIRLAQPRIVPTLTEIDNALVVTNTFQQPLRGRLALKAPEEWTISPSRLQISLEPGAKGIYPLKIRVPTNQGVEHRSITAALTIEGEPERMVPVAIPLELAADDLAAEVLIEWRGERLFIRHTMTNRTVQTLDLQSFVLAPNRIRLTHLVRGLAPGATAMRVYELEDPTELLGKSLRVGLEQIDGPRKLNQVVRVGEEANVQQE